MAREKDLRVSRRPDLFFVEASGFSMWPFIKSGERLIIKRTPIEDLRMGDVILYRANNQTVCHRLIKKIKNKERYLLYARGDSSISSPESVNEKMFLGKAIGILKNGKIINLGERKSRLINRLIIMIAPLISAGVKIGKALINKKR